MKKNIYFIPPWNKYNSPFLWKERIISFLKVIAFSYLLSHLHKNRASHGGKKGTQNKCGNNTTDVAAEESL